MVKSVSHICVRHLCVWQNLRRESSSVQVEDKLVKIENVMASVPQARTNPSCNHVGDLGFHLIVQ